MNTVFPVELEFFSPAGEKLSSSLLQGFTRDVGEGGLCVELKSFGRSTEGLFSFGNALELVINPTFLSGPVRAGGKIAWVRKEDSPHPPHYTLGVAYTRIDPAANRKIIRFAKRLVWVPRLAAAAGVVLLAALAFFVWHNQKLVGENKKLVGQLIASAEKKSEIASRLEAVEKRKAELASEMRSARSRIKGLEESLAARKRLSEAIKALEAGKKDLQKSLEAASDLGAGSSKEVFRRMMEWVRSHQNLRTGLVASFEGDVRLEDWAFTYDQALACQVFLLFQNREAAEAVLDFFDRKAERKEGAFFNGYYAADGYPVESVIHVGPNVWIGIAALQHGRATGSERFLPLAESVADWLIGRQDAEGGFQGGPGFSWYSTEHHLDAYAFLGMLHQKTGKEKYKRARDRVLGWIKKYAYSAKDKRMNRGKGDATIATDTFSWAIAAIGPPTLAGLAFDPEAIMDFAEKNCEVTVSFAKPDGQTISATGFDFAKAKNLGRGGVLSTEWTAQMAVSYRVLSDYFRSIGDSAKAARYREKTDFYLNELQKLVITSPSRVGQGRGCLPYASQDDADTGHGWRTPRGKRTGSVAGTAYGLFAWMGYNPFDLGRFPGDTP
ncbi:MAG: PilZ domain-containing protein [Candidatus Omnitrophica bacterium]|nr:PilZ domain-containing protein [Candidatus Omnitrophota bacterium]